MQQLSSYQLVTRPTLWPLTLDEAKVHLRVAHTEQDDLIQSIIESATMQFEKDAQVNVLSTAFKLVLDEAPQEVSGWNAHILIWKNPNVEVQSIKYYNADSEQVELSTDNYEVDNVSAPTRIRLTEDVTVADKLNAFEVNFTVGYAAADDVPEDIKQCIRFLLGHYYENPDAVVTGTQVNELPLSYKHAVRNFITRWI